jgi:hypothetical protein
MNLQITKRNRSHPALSYDSTSVKKDSEDEDEDDKHHARM